MAGVGLAFFREDLAVFVPLGFVCLLRPVEICTLTPRDLLFALGVHKVLLHLGITKRSAPNSQEVVCHDRVISLALQQAIRRLYPRRPFYRGRPSVFSKDLRMLCRALGFHSDRVSGYCLRRGGATWHFHRFGSVSLTAALGRWKQERTVRIYVEGAAAEAASWQLSDSQSKLALMNKRFSNVC